MFTKGLSITKILGGISKGLTIMEQVIPIYQKVSPTINNLRNIVSNYKYNNINNIYNNINKKTINNIYNNINKKTITNNSNSHNPTFFN